MGGFGSGKKWSTHRRQRVVGYGRSIDTKWLKDRGHFTGHLKHVIVRWKYLSKGPDALNIFIDTRKPGEEAIHFLYRYAKGGHSQICEYSVKLDTTPCRLGGKRYWFRCPLCKRRCFELFLPIGEKVFACRLCHRLTYLSCLNSHKKDVLPDFEADNFDIAKLTLHQLSRLSDIGY